MTSTEQFHYDYWNQFLKQAFQNENFSKEFKRTGIPKRYWIGFGVGNSSCILNLVHVKTKKELRVELYIKNNKKLYDSLFSKKTIIEKDSKLVFDWQKIPQKKDSRIVIFKDANINDKNDWENQFKWLIQTAIKVKKAFIPYI